VLTISNLNLKPQWIYRCNPPKGQYHIAFKLDPKSEYYLVEEARKLDSKKEVKKLVDAIENAACVTVMKMPEKELTNGNIGEQLRLNIDPINKSRLFAIQIKLNGAKDQLAITKAEILKEQDIPEIVESSSDKPQVSVVRKLYFPKQTTYLREDLKQQISLKLKVDIDSANSINNIASGFHSEGEVEEFEKTISSLVRYSAMRITLEELRHINKGGYVIKSAEAPFDKNRFFLFEFKNLDGNDMNQLAVTKIEIFNREEE